MGRAVRTLNRRTFLGVLGGATGGLMLTRWGRANARSVPPVVPAPSMTTTVRNPTILSAHCAVLGAPMALPVVRAERMQVSAVLTEPAMVKAQVWPTDTPASVTESPWIPTAVGTDPTNPVNVAKFWMPAGCGVAGTAWSWRVFTALAGTAPTAPLAAAWGTDKVVRTIPRRPVAGDPQGFAFAVGSCSQIAHPSAPPKAIPAAVSMAATNIAFMTHLGDTSYVDTWTEYLQDTDAHCYTKFGTGLRHHFDQADLARLYGRVPVRMVIDDHDSGPDNDYAATVYPQARQSFADIAAGTTFDNRLYDAVNPGAPSYDTWTVGDTQFWLLDNRLWRDTPTHGTQTYGGQPYSSQLGATQSTWLMGGLAASTAPVKIILSPRTFTQFYAGGEQQKILDWITGFRSQSPQVSGIVVFLTGDMHAGAVWKLSATRPVYEMLCGPIDNTTLHSPKKLAAWQATWGYETRFLNTAGGVPGPAISNAWGLVDVLPNNGGVVLNLMKDDGKLLYQETVSG